MLVYVFAKSALEELDDERFFFDADVRALVSQ